MTSKMKIAIVGLGAVGRALAKHLSNHAIPNAELVAVAARDKDKARTTLKQLNIDVEVLDIQDLVSLADVVVECAPAAILEDIAKPVLEAGKKVVVLSVGGLLSHPYLVDIAARTGGQIIVPTGALLGLDAVSAAAEGHIRSVRMVTHKPIKGLVGAPFLIKNGINIESIDTPLLLFKGTAREAAKGFPANLNVAVALALAGIGPDKTYLEIWADPGITRNTHRVIVDSDVARLDMTIENVPSENPRTGKITALSVLATLRKINAPLRVGS